MRRFLQQQTQEQQRGADPKQPIMSCIDDDCESSLVQAIADAEADSSYEAGSQPLIANTSVTTNQTLLLNPNITDQPFPLDPALDPNFKVRPPWNETRPEHPPGETDDGGGMSSGMLAGAILGGAIVLGVVFAIFVLVKCRKHRRRALKQQQELKAAAELNRPSSSKAIQLAQQKILPSPFMTSITASTTLRRDPVLSWVASELNSGARHLSMDIKDEGEGSTSNSEPSMPGTPSQTNSGGGYRMIDINEISIQRVIGEGSYGRVYQAIWNLTPIAFKMLIDPRTWANEEAAKKQSARVTAALEREAGLMSHLRHPNIVQFLGACAFPPGILTDWCSRGSLHEVLQLAKESEEAAAQVTWQRRLQILLDAAKGMLYLHAIKPTPVVHRDLKSANLLVTRDWTCKVADFNLSRLMDDEMRGSSGSGGSGPGNPRWLAPEIFTGSPFTTATDAYAFAMVMLELLVWDVPWKTRHEWSIVGLVQAGERPEIPPESELRGPNGEAFVGLAQYVALMQRAWSQDPAARPAFEEITATLKQLAVDGINHKLQQS